MKSEHNIAYIALVGFFLLVASCKEEFIIETQYFESVLVVEATITNELKFHEVKLSRTYVLEDSEENIENDAVVRVVDNNGNIFNFTQSNNGIYISDQTFQAQPLTEYTLLINTSDGKSYSSDRQQLTALSQIDQLYAEYKANGEKGPGIQVFVDSNNENSNAQYFRYDFEETYQIIPPYYYKYETVLTNYYEEYTYTPLPDLQVFFDTEFIERPEEQETCYGTQKNVEILLNQTSELNENIVLAFPIRFIEFDDSILRDRYSIQVKQYVQNIAAHTYYKVINSLGDNESILSENQPGYIQGNIFQSNNSYSKIIGFFEVSSVTQKRIYFNYADFGLNKPDYGYACELYELDYEDNHTADFDRNQRQEIYRLLTQFEEYNFDNHIIQQPLPNVNTIWKISNPECTDCTTVGSNIEPDYWQD